MAENKRYLNLLFLLVPPPTKLAMMYDQHGFFKKLAVNNEQRLLFGVFARIKTIVE